MKRCLQLTVILIFISVNCSTSNGYLAENINVYFSPNGGCQDAILKEINNAKKEILIAMFHFAEDEIVEALLKASSRDINITLIIDKSKTEEKDQSKAKTEIKSETTINELLSKGKNIRLYTHRNAKGLMHNKFAVIDENVVITGSFNWTKSAEKSNYENLLLIRSPEIANRYKEEFKKILSAISSKR